MFQTDQLSNVGHFIVAIDIAHFIPLEEFEKRGQTWFERLKSCKTRPGMRAVSYTHLPYQFQTCFLIFVFVVANYVIAKLSMATTSMIGMFLPVSYTHLDVYKRQMIHFMQQRKEE